MTITIKARTAALALALLCVLHMIRKTSKTVPRAEIEIAKQRWQDFKDRMRRGRASRHAPPAEMLRDSVRPP